MNKPRLVTFILIIIATITPLYGNYENEPKETQDNIHYSTFYYGMQGLKSLYYLPYSLSVIAHELGHAIAAKIAYNTL